MNVRPEKFVQVYRLYITDVSDVLTNYLTTSHRNEGLTILYDNNDTSKPYVTIDTDMSSHYLTRGRVTQNLYSIITVYLPVIKDIDELSHLELLHRAGDFLNFLRLGSLYANCSAYLKCHGFFLNYIFQNYPSLHGLVLTGLTIAKCSPIPQSNTLIKRVEMFECNLSHQVFPELSLCLASLSNLWISDHFQVDSEGRMQNDYNHYIIEMPNTSFDTPTWQRHARTFIDYTSINVKIVTLAKLYCYCAEENGAVVESSDVLFYKSMDIQDSLSLYIQCQDIKHLHLFLYCPTSWRINFT